LFDSVAYLILDGERNISTAISTTPTEIKPTPMILSIIDAVLKPRTAVLAPAPRVKLKPPAPVKFLGKPVPLPNVNLVVDKPGAEALLKIDLN